MLRIMQCLVLMKTQHLSFVVIPLQGLYLKLLACLSPLMLSTFVGCTRLTDFKHDFSDVNAGAFIGIMSGFLGHSLNFHSVFSSRSGAPKLRGKGASSDNALPLNRNDYKAPAGDEGTSRQMIAHDLEEGARD